MSAELKSLLTQDFLQTFAEAIIPIGKQEQVENFGDAISKALFTSQGNLSRFEETTVAALKIISKYGLEHIPEWMHLLPLVEDSSFPTEALGLQLVLDQGPRIFLKGVDQRWASGYFDDIAGKFALSLESLDPDLRPSSWTRWKSSATIEYWILLRLFYGAPLVHNEKMADLAVAFTDETRVVIEQHFNARDPIRDQPEVRWDLLGFPKMLKSGPPTGGCDTPTGGFWIQLLMDVHKPPLDRFGRYPYRNWVLGRSMSQEEEEWLEECDYFRSPPEEVLTKIHRDIAEGVWSPLGSG